MMTFFYFLLYLEDFIWIFPAFRQLHERNRVFFGAYAISGIIQILCFMFHNPYFALYTVFLTLPFVAFSFEEFHLLSSFRFVAISFSSIVLILVKSTLPDYYCFSLLLIFLLIILIIFLRRFIIDVTKSFAINIFCLFIILYQLSALIRFFMVLSNTRAGTYYYFFSAVFETLLGVFFAIFKESDKRLFIKLVPDHSKE